MIRALRIVQLNVLLLLMQLPLHAQVYPVQVVSQLLPPYTLNVSDYYQGTQEKLVVLLTNTDLTKPVLQVRLKLSIQGQNAKLKSRDGVYYPPITLDGGAPQRITLADLAPYFNIDNLELEGITRSQYQQSQKLPEGFYQFCFEAYEYNTNRLVGRSHCTMAWISLLDPPLLNLPRKTESIAYKDPANIIFQWTPRNMGSPTAAFNTEYEFTLVELWDNGIAPEAAFGTMQPLFRTTTQTTTLLYGPAEPLLIPGKRYGWRIRAQASDGSQNTDAYRNNGYSEIFWFTYQRDCPMPFNVQSEVSGGRATITWNAALQQTRFSVDYREKGQTASQWYTVNSSTNRVMLYDLKKDKQYEYRVGAYCDGSNDAAFPANGAVYSDIKSFHIDGSSVDTTGGGCNILQPELKIANRNPIQSLMSGDVIMAGDFPVKLITVAGQGNFTGTGYITIPFIGKVAVKVRFSNITVNTDKQLIGGVIETTYDKKESQIADLDKAIDGGGGAGIVVRGVDTAGYYVDMVIPDAKNIGVDLTTKVDSAGNIEPTGGATLKITGNDGAVKEVEVEKLPATIKDKNGTIYSIDKDGHVAKLASNEPMNMTSSELNRLQTDKAVVKFIPHENQQYAFDEYQPVYSRSNLFKPEYEKLNDNYFVNSKAIVEAKSDVIKAVVEIKDNTIIADSIRFITGKGTRYESSLIGDKTYEIRIVGGPAADAQELYALYPKGGGKYLSLGKLLIASYPERTFKLVLVPVNGATLNKDVINQQLDAIYKPVGISFQVTQDESFNDKSWDLNHDEKLAVSGSGWLSTLTGEMKALNSAYTGARTVQQDAVYLFVLNSSDSTLAGDMPRGKQFGYLFTGSDGKTAAHEIGHGLFKLKHAFDNEYGFKQGDLPSNVMDYPAGNTFAKYQWNQLYNPGLVIGLFESDGDGQSQYVGDLDAITLPGSLYYQPTSTERTFMSPGGKLVVFPAGDELKDLRFKMCEKDGPASYPLGCLLEFTCKGVRYANMYFRKSLVFCHYSGKSKIEEYLKTNPRNVNLLDKFEFDYKGMAANQPYNAVVLLQHPNQIDKVMKSVVPIRHDGKAKGNANDSKNGIIIQLDVVKRPEATVIELVLSSSCTSIYAELLKGLLNDDAIGTLKVQEAISFVTTHANTTDATRNKIVKNIGFYIDKLGGALYKQMQDEAVYTGMATGGDREYLDYLGYLKGFWDMMEKSGTDAAKVTNPELLVDYYWKKYSEFKSLDDYTRAWKVEDRLKVLKTLVKADMAAGGNFWAYMIKEAGWYNSGFGMEDFAISIVGNTPVTDRETLLTGLLKDSLMVNLISHIDNAGLGKDNFDRLFTHIIEFSTQKIKEKSVTMAELASQKRVYLWKTAFFTNTPSFKAVLLPSGKVSVTTKTVKPQDIEAFIKKMVSEATTTTTVPVQGIQVQATDVSVELDPFTPVLLVLGEAPSNNIAPLQNQSMIVVPAVALDWLWRTNHTRIYSQWGKRAVDVGLTALSFGAWSGASTTGKVIIALNTAFVAGDLLVSESHIKANLLKSTAGKNFLTWYYACMAVTAVADLTTAMSGLQNNADNFVQAYDEVAMLRNADGTRVITEGSDFEQRTKNLYQTLKDLGYGATVNKLAQAEQKIGAVLQKLDNFYDKTKITLQAVKEAGVLKIKQTGTYGQFVLGYWDDIKGIFKEELFNWADLMKIKYLNPQMARLEMTLAGDAQGAFLFAKTTETGPLGKSIERIRAIPDNPGNIRNAIGVIRNELNISDDLFNNTFFKSILQKFESKGVTGIDEARGFMEEIKRLQIEDALKADLQGSRAKGLSELLTESADLSIYKQIKDDPLTALSHAEERYAGLANKDKWEKWGKSEFFKAATKKGSDFEDHITDLVKMKNADLWKDLKAAIPDLENRTIFTQVHFCVPGKMTPCNDAGDYFIADLVFVKYGKDSKGKAVIEDMVIGEVKLSDGTVLTDGQRAAKAAPAGTKLSVRSITKSEDVHGDLLPADLTNGSQVKKAKFVEIRGNGEGAYVPGGVN
jgi:TANFOR domain-containing protein